jgi:hypothetical protein
MTKSRVLIAILFFALLIIVGFFLYFNQTDLSVKISSTKVEQENNSSNNNENVVPIDSFRQAKEDKKQRILAERKEQLELYKFAVENSKTENCAKLTDEMSQEVCVEQIALKEDDDKLCEQIKNASTTERCIDEVLLQKALKTKQIELCSGIIGASLQKACQQKIIDFGISLADCEKISLKHDYRTWKNMHEVEARDVCLSQIMLVESIKRGDLESCYNIPLDASKAQCIMFLTGKAPASDDDNDGLNYYQELIAGTDPEKADTDGDGFKDGQELGDGYNPIGPGTLQDFIENTWYEKN